MTANVTALTVTVVTTAVLGAVAYLRAPDRPSNRLFAWHASWVTAWSLVTTLVLLTTDAGHVAQLMRLLHFVAAMMLTSFVDFIWVFPHRLRPMPLRRRAVLYAAGTAFGLVASLPQIVTSVRIVPGGVDVRFGWPLAVFGVYAFPMVAHVNWLLVRRLRMLQGIARVQVLYVFAGTLCSELVILSTNVVLPMAAGNTRYSSWGAVGYLATVIAMGIAVTKYRLWDLSTLGQRVAAAVLTAGGLATAGAAAVWGLTVGLRVSGQVPGHVVGLWVAMGAGLGLCAAPIYATLRGLLWRSAEEEKQRIGTLLATLGSAVVHALPGEEVLQPILEQAQRFFNSSFVAAYLRPAGGAVAPEETVFRFAGGVDVREGPWAAADDDESGGPSSRLPEVLPPELVEVLDVARLREAVDIAELMRFGSLEDALRKMEAMGRLEAHLIIPLQWQDDTFGLLVLGAKVSRDMYSHEDLVLLRSVAAYAAIAAKNAELRAQLLAEKEQTEKVLERMESGVVVVDVRKVVRLVNPAACRLLGQDGETLSTEQLVGASWRVLPRALQAPLEQALTTGQTISGQRLVLNGAKRRVACSSFLLEGVGGECEGAGVVFRDLSTEDALYWVERETERLRFIRAVSAGLAHEIRNPLVAIRTFAELAPSRLDDPEFRESFLQVARSEVGRLEELVSQFMTLSRPVRPVREPVDVAGMLQEAVTAVSAGAERKGVRVRMEERTGLGHSVSGTNESGEGNTEVRCLRGDEQRLRQALMNLLLNALDATPAGGEIHLTADLAAGDDGPEVHLTVWNSGSYIAPEHLERVFEPFFTSKATGVGLGLAICHTIADEHGGTVSVSSDEEAGTAFTVKLPLVTAHDLAAQHEPQLS